MLRKTVIFIPLLLGLALTHIAAAQTVDPCQYGCPKDGCGCPDEGGPIESDESDPDKESDDDSGDDDSDEDSSGNLPA